MPAPTAAPTPVATPVPVPVATPAPTPAPATRIPIFARMGTVPDNVVADSANHAFFTEYVDRMEVFSTWFDSQTAWYPRGLAYKDLITVNKSVIGSKDPYVLRDSDGARLSNPWGAYPLPQYAMDISNPAYRTLWINELKTTLAKGYKGVWMDDVNLDVDRSVVREDGSRPLRDMSWWSEAVVAFSEQVRAAIPTHEILHNPVWFARRPARWADPLVKREIAAADLINRETGVLDGGLGAGSGEWSVRSVLSYTDQVHAQNKGVVWDSWPASNADREYMRAIYLVTRAPNDYAGDNTILPTSRWAGWDLDVGAALGARTDDGTTITRRFERATVTVVPGPVGTRSWSIGPPS